MQSRHPFLAGWLQGEDHPDEVDVAEVVLRSFVDINVDVHFVVFDVESVMRDDGVAVAEFVVAVDEVHFVFLVVALDEFGGLEDAEFHAVGEIIVHVVLDVLGLIVSFVLEAIGDGRVRFVERHEAETLFGLLHGAEQYGIGDAFVAVDVDFLDFDFFGLSLPGFRSN